MRKALLSAIGLYLWLVLTLVVSGCGPSQPATPQTAPPQAQFSANVREGQAPLKVDFTNTSQNADAFTWDFGDASAPATSQGNEPVSHAYAKAGTHTVTLTAVQGSQPDKPVTMTLTITVKTGPPSQVKINPDTVKLDIGKSQKLSATALDAAGNVLPDAQLTWETTDGSGTISEGTFTAGTRSGTFGKGVGVTAAVGGQSAKASASVSINPGPLEKVTVSASQVAAGQTKQLEAVASDQYGNRITGLEEAWTVLDENLGAVSKSGQLAAAEVARTFSNSVEVQVKQGSLTQTAKGPITITPGPVAQVVIAPTPLDLGMGMAQQFVAVGADKFGNRISGLTFKWSADKGGSIDSKGLFTGSVTPGTYKDSVKVEATQGDKTVSAVASVTIEPDRIVFVSNRNDDQTDVYITDTEGNNVERLTRTKAPEYMASSSPDGRRILYESFVVSGGLAVINDDGSWPDLLTANSSNVACLDPTWSPDGKKVAFSKLNIMEGKIKDSGLYVMDVDGGNARQLVYNTGARAESPAWSPDGRRIAFFSSSSQFALNVIDADGNNLRQIMSMQGTTDNPAWSPDGKKLAFQSYKPGLGGVLQYEIFIAEADGTNIIQLTDNRVHDTQPAWSVDGKKIYFASRRDTTENKKTQLYVMDVDGRNVKRLTTNDADDLRPQPMARKAGLNLNEASVIIPNSSTLKKSLSTQALAAKARKAVIRIKTNIGSGSGFFVDPNGLIMTANHVVTDAKEINVYLEDGTKYAATIKSRDIVHDLALLKIEAASLPFLEIGDIGQVSLGQQVIVLGYPMDSQSVYVTSGLVSTIKADSGNNITWVQTDSAVNPGNSGGPMLDLYGKVTGIVTRKKFGAEGMGYAISANSIRNYMPQLR